MAKTDTEPKRDERAAIEQHYPATAAVALDVARERVRQIEVERRVPAFDDAYADGVLTAAAACYCLHGNTAAGLHALKVITIWPFSVESFTPKTRERDLIRAAALILAEIERMRRAADKGKAA